MQQFEKNGSLIWLLTIWLTGALAHSGTIESQQVDLAPVQVADSGNVACSSQNMVATVHPLATEAGVAALARGGNAVDAAVAAALTLGVVDGFNSGIGGGCFILARTAEGKFVAIDGREMAPAAAHRDMYLVDGIPDTDLSQTGPLAIGVPGALKAYDKLLRDHGNLNLADLILPAAEIAEQGFAISDVYAGRLDSVAKVLNRFSGSRDILLRPDGSPWQSGQRLRQIDLANTYRLIAREGVDYFYRGDFARRTGEWMAENGGLLTAGDFANYQCVERQPIQTTYRDYTVVGFPPPSSGGVHVAQILNILENFDLSGNMDEDRQAHTIHLVAEAMKLAFADRAHWLGDPDFANVPRGLIDKQYAGQLAARINPDASTAVKSHGVPPRADDEFFERHTTHLTAADAAGNWVAITATVNTTFGSKVIVPGLGVVMNNQMDDFAIAPGVPNAFGLVGAEANSVAAGKRPLSSMSPTIVLRNDGQPVLTVGAAGGPKIITQALLAIVRHLDFEQSLADAVGQHRFHHQWSPDALLLEQGFDTGLVQRLESMGHQIRTLRSMGITQGIAFDPESGLFTGVHDPRTPGAAAGQ